MVHPQYIQATFMRVASAVAKCSAFILVSLFQLRGQIGSNMALSQAAFKAEQAIGHGDNAVTAQDVTNPALDREKYGDPTENMKALAWMGKNDVQIGIITTFCFNG